MRPIHGFQPHPQKLSLTAVVLAVLISMGIQTHCGVVICFIPGELDVCGHDLHHFPCLVETLLLQEGMYTVQLPKHSKVKFVGHYLLRAGEFVGLAILPKEVPPTFTHVDLCECDYN